MSIDLIASQPMTRHTPAPARCGAFPAMPNDAIGDLPSSQGFGAMLSAYRSTGGTARENALAQLIKDHFLGNFVSLAHLISSNEVFSFPWRDTLWIPMFQFDPSDLSVKNGPRQVLAALGSEFDGWARAAWFATPNSWLNHQRPVDLLGSHLPNVLDAATADHFVAAG